MKRSLLIVPAAGFLLAISSAYSLKGSNKLHHNQNTFAIRSSGYGQVLARLSQDTVNKVWHYGIEGVNPTDGHVCSDEGCDHHDHEDHGHQHSLGRKAKHEDHGHDHHGEKKSHEHVYAHAESSGAFLNLRSVAALSSLKKTNPLEAAMEFIESMRNDHFQRTNPIGLSAAHKQAVSQDIEQILLRSYRMDPTDYGVYSSYYLFLTVHEYRATPAARDHARLVADITITEATKEKEAPFPWLTAANALLDQFFLDQQKARDENSALSSNLVLSYSQRIEHCLAQYSRLKDSAVRDGRWESIGAPRRAEAEQRFRFIERASAQFRTLLSGVETASPLAQNEGPLSKL